jgi:GT2 family glycosyltransferase
LASDLTESAGRSFSFVLPAHNEAAQLPQTLRSIRENVPQDRLAEIIVVDNGSNDDTALVAQAEGARVLREPVGSLGYLRNCGARAASGAVLVFLDSDVSLTPNWTEGLEDLDGLLRQEASVIAGSRCRIPADSSWVARAWSSGAGPRGPVQYLGTGHLVVPAPTFAVVGGFDERLRTGEDYEFCRAARSQGIPVIALPSLEAIHHGEPRSLKEFFRREVWHGTGDTQSIVGIIRSRVAMAAILFAGLHFVLLLGFVSPWLSFPLSAAVSVPGVVILIGLVAQRRNVSFAPASVAPLLVLSYTYLWARFVSLARLGHAGRWRKGRGEVPEDTSTAPGVARNSRAPGAWPPP